jgi:hypothetical protein
VSDARAADEWREVETEVLEVKLGDGAAGAGAIAHGRVGVRLE